MNTEASKRGYEKQVGAFRTLYEEMVIDGLKVDRRGRRERRSEFLGNSKFRDLTRELGRGNISTHCFEGDDSTLSSFFPLVARQPNSRGASNPEFMKDPETSMIEGVANRYWVETTRSVVFDILDSIKMRRNETRGDHGGSTTQWSEASRGMEPVSSRSKESKHSMNAARVWMSRIWVRPISTRNGWLAHSLALLIS